ncbi:MAG: hypothetical protein GF307_03650 [candidate division Zixibacteria bacterium]|nr:hypothetical protein [candidate division Zixibacteria bacterium]
MTNRTATVYKNGYANGRMKLRDNTKIIFFGDSITHGVFGESYLKELDRMLSGKFPNFEYRLINKGRSGDTVYSLLKRVERDVISLSPHIVVIMIGGNDVLLKHADNYKILQEKTGIKDQIPARNIAEFKDSFRKLINHIKGSIRTRIVLCTPPTIGEDLKNRYNREMVHYNIVIRKIAMDYHLDMIDINAAFHRELRGSHPRHDVVPRMTDIYDDLEKLKETSADKLSKERGLTLTYDGGHLNSKGARLIAEHLFDYLVN